MSNIDDLARKQRKEKESKLSTLEKAKVNEEKILTDLTKLVSNVLNNYHNQLRNPDSLRVNSTEAEMLPRLLRIVADGVEHYDNNKKE